MLGKSKIYAALLLAVCLVGFLFGGCDVVDGFTNRDMQELLQPPMTLGEYSNIVKAMENYMNNNPFTLILPGSGDYNSAYTVSDIDGDGADEAIAFYKHNAEVCLGILDKGNDSWTMRQSITGKGNNIYDIGLHDLDNDNVDEIVVMWGTDSNDTTRILEVYKFNGKEFVLVDDDIENDNINCNECVVVDFIPDNDVLEIFVVNVDRIIGVASFPLARVYAYDTASGTLKFVGSKLLNDKLATGCASIKATQKVRVNGVIYNPMVVVDSISVDGHYMTEIFAWDSDENTFSSEFSSDNIGTFERKTTVVSADVNNDGLIEIPVEKEFNNTNQVGRVDPDYVTDKHIIQWVTYEKNNYFEVVKYSFVNQEFNYMLIIPEKWVDNSAFMENRTENEIIIYHWDKQNNRPVDDEYDGIYMSAKVFILSEWIEYNEKNKGDKFAYHYCNTVGSLVYAVRFGSDSYPGQDSSAIEIIK